MEELLPELGLSANLVSSPQLHAINLWVLIWFRRESPPNNLVLVELQSKHNIKLPLHHRNHKGKRYPVPIEGIWLTLKVTIFELENTHTLSLRFWVRGCCGKKKEGFWFSLYMKRDETLVWDTFATGLLFLGRTILKPNLYRLFFLFLIIDFF